MEDFSKAPFSPVLPVDCDYLIVLATIDEALEEENDTESILLIRSINGHHIPVQLTITFGTLLHRRVYRGIPELAQPPDARGTFLVM